MHVVVIPRESVMSNRAYLASSDVESIYPSAVQEDYDPAQQLICSSIGCVPLLWLTLFRESDLKRTNFEIHGEKIEAFAPIALRDQAIGRLNETVPYLGKILPWLGSLRDHAAMLRKAIAAVPNRFISIEIEEIAGLYPPEHRFEELFALALRGFTHPGPISFHCKPKRMIFPMEGKLHPDTVEELKASGASLGPDGQWGIMLDGINADSHAGVLEQIAQLEKDVAVAPARFHLDEVDCSDGAKANFGNVLGFGWYESSGYGRTVPWEPAGD